MKKSLFLLGIAALLLLVPSVAALAVTTDTPYLTLITAEGQYNTLNYTDYQGNQKSQVTTTNLTVVVQPMYGFTGLADLGDQSTAPGLSKDWDYMITNEGNNSDNYGMKYTVAYTNCTGLDWTVKLLNGSGTIIATLDGAGTRMVTTGAVGEDSLYNLSLLVIPSTQEQYAQNGSFATVTLDVTTSATPVGIYTGVNGNSYGGTKEAIDTWHCTIETSVMTMTRTATVDSPTQYMVNAGVGHAHDAVPGAVVTYTITYSNLGSSTAESVVIRDKVPSSTEAAHVGANSGGQSTLPNVTITCATWSATGWMSYYTTFEPPLNSTYGNMTGWTTIGAWPADLHTLTTIKYVKWEKQHVLTDEDNKTLTWGVTIK